MKLLYRIFILFYLVCLPLLTLSSGLKAASMLDDLASRDALDTPEKPADWFLKLEPSGLNMPTVTRNAPTALDTYAKPLEGNAPLRSTFQLDKLAPNWAPETPQSSDQDEGIVFEPPGDFARPDKALGHPLSYALKSMFIPGQGQVELNDELSANLIRAGEAALIGSALLYQQVRNSNYALAQAALTQSEQDLYYQNALGAYTLNNTLLWLAAALYGFNVWQAWSQANTLYQLAYSKSAAAYTVSLHWDVTP